ncbi:histidine ammonia-lyase [Burkholderia lata]|uniref:Histidine ammonia-lyase n=1 Tax=Burkholderia lata (strain ATCC 17760 / DSM 23089 / LMG 22485 / NCIMB 9086 / R18194 / 383) TaxID=482957 RepID=A0A6P2R4W6_BURL3|nr:histidine ammonia-lyase [Burkholderia lata]VWC29822.1 histidine ammonia-lyase [Burkholderia lata]
MSFPYPSNGAVLVSMRRAGRVPELPVLVALAGPLRFDNVTLSARAGQPYDWRPVAALNVEVFASADVHWSDLLRTLADIAAAVPDTLVLAFREGPRVHCGERRAVHGEDFALFDWFPMPIAPMCWPASHTLARRLFDALGDTLPNPYDHACELVVQLAAERNRNAEEVT